MSAKPRRRVAGARPALAVAALSLTLVVFSGCASPREIARGEAITAVRANAQALRDEIASAPAGTFGEAQLQAVRAVLPDQSLAAPRDTYRRSFPLLCVGAVPARLLGGAALTAKHTKQWRHNHGVCNTCDKERSPGIDRLQQHGSAEGEGRA